MCINRLCKAAYSLIFFTSLSFAHSPPSVDTPIDFYFDSQSEATTFSLSQCDANNNSWRVCQALTCAVGDPLNVTCIVSMCYYATDVNECSPDNSIPGGYIELIPVDERDVMNDGNGTNKALLDDLHYYAESQVNALQDLERQNSNLLDSGKRQESILKSILRVNSTAANYSGIIQAIRDTEYYNAQRHQEVSEEMISQKWLLPHVNQLKQNQLDSLDADADSSERLLGSINNLGDKTSLNGNYLASINLSNSTIAGHAYDTKSELVKLNTLLEDSQLLSIARSARETEINTTKMIDELKAISGSTESDDGTGPPPPFCPGGCPEEPTAPTMLELLTSIDGSLSEIKSGAGDGNGGGDPDNPDDGETVTENSCTSFTCTSDSAVCYLARKQWETDCASLDAVLGNDGTLDNLTDQIGQYVNDPDSDIKNIEAGTVDTSSFMNKYTDGSGFNVGSNTCPAPYVVDITITFFTLDLTPFCDLAVVIRWFVIAFSTVGAGLMVAKFS